MNEATCKAALCRLLRESVVPRGGVVYRHEDTFTGGIPDISVNLGGRTLWVEVKLDKPGRPGRVTALQEAALLSLQGVLLRYQLSKDGSLCAVIRNYKPGAPEFDTGIAAPRKVRVQVHRVVAAGLLSELERRG